MRHVVIALAVVVGAVVTLGAFELKPHTLASWERYIGLHDALWAENRANDDIPFLWVDQQPTPDRAGFYARLNRGEVIVERFELREEGEKVDVDDGKIHHWYGAVFIPGATIDEVLAWVQDYSDYPVRFTPLIDSAEVLSQEDDRWTVRMRNRMKKVITIVMDVDYVIDYQRVSPTRLETMNVATNIFQVHDAGESKERREPGDDAGGYLWRFRMVCRFDQRDEGTFEECENLSLTRNVPILLRWLVNPFVSSVPRETIEFNMGAVRDGVGKR